MSSSTLSPEQMRVVLRRQQEARKELRYYRWMDIESFNWATHGRHALELLDLAYELGGAPRESSGLVQWYSALKKCRHA